MSKVWFITGSSRGLGRSLTEAVLQNGDRVVATARNPEALNNLKLKYGNAVLPLAVDVTNVVQITKAVADAVAHFGGIDVVVNNAGFGITGAAEAFTEEQITRQIDANLYGVIHVTRAVLPQLRKQRSGFIMQVSSIGGRVGNPGVSIYQAAKFGVVGFSEAVAKEVAPLGIKLTIVEPGGFRTDWAGDSMSFAPEIEDYEQTVGAMSQYFRSGKFVPLGDPAKAARVMIDLANHPTPPVHLVLGSEAVSILKNAEARKMAELEEWLPISTSTDADGAEDFFASEAGQLLLKR